MDTEALRKIITHWRDDPGGTYRTLGSWEDYLAMRAGRFGSGLKPIEALARTLT